MKQKKIVGPVPRFTLSSICMSNNATINETVKLLNHTTDYSVQQKCLKTLSDFLKNDEENDEYKCALQILASVYMSCTAKHPLKKSLIRILMPLQDNDLLLNNFSQLIKYRMQKLRDGDATLLMRVEFFNCLYTSLDLKAVAVGVLELADVLFIEAVDFVNELVDILWERSLIQLTSGQDLNAYIYNTTKFILCILQRCANDNFNSNYKLIVIKSLHKIIIHKEITFETKCNCGHIMAFLLRKLPADFTEECVVPNYPFLDLLVFSKTDTPMLRKLGVKRIEDETMSEMFQICTFIGISIVAPGDILYKYKLSEKVILSFMLEKLIHSATNNKQNLHQIMGVSKALTLLSFHVQHLHVEEIKILLSKYLKYLNIYIDNVPDVVKNNSTIIFKNLIKVASIFNSKGHDVMNIVMSWFKSLRGSSNFHTVMVILSSEIGCEEILNDNPNLPKELLGDLLNHTKASNVLSSFERLMQMHRKEVKSVSEWIDHWVKEIIIQLKQANDSQAYIDLFVSVFKIENYSLTVLTESGMLINDSEILAVLACVHLARKTGIELDFSRHFTTSTASWRKLFEYKFLQVLKTHLNDDIRILTLGIVVDSHSTTEVFTEWELDFLVDYLYYNINVPNLSFRQKLVSYIKKAMQRLSDVAATLKNKIETARNCERAGIKEKLLENVELVSEPVLKSYTRFWASLFSDVLLQGLQPDSNYLRKSTSLEILLMAKTFLPEVDFEKLWSAKDVDNLKYIIGYDTYEHNKETATKLLIEFSPSRLNFHTKENVHLYIDKCLESALSVKPVQTISAAYMFMLCLKVPIVNDVIFEKLQNSAYRLCSSIHNARNDIDDSFLLLTLLRAELRVCLQVAQVDIHEAASSKPIHGLIFCIRHILNNTKLNVKGKLEHWRIFCQDLIDLCLELTNIVNTIVCNDSPEGYLPEDSNLDLVDGTVKAQMITVYGWRATKEISLLFGELSLNAPFCYSSEGLINEGQILRIGQYFFDLLINTKHRGAFEQASIGFCNLCSRLWRLFDTSVNVLPLQWLDTVSALLNGSHTDGIKSCETRRSAGVPFMVQAILSTEPVSASTSKHFDSLMMQLLHVSSNDLFPAEQRILGLNILRALYRHNKLGESVIPYCSQGIIIAVKGFRCTVWGIRNSATLLFSALIMRMFGVQRIRDVLEVNIKNKIQGQVFFVRYPELFRFLLEELETASKERYHSSLYPILLILSRLYCNKEALDRSQLDVFLPYVELCLNNPSLKIRELAAYVILTLTEPSKLMSTTLKCISKLTDSSISNNYCHGLLLELQYLLRLQDTLSNINIDIIVSSTLWIIELCGFAIHPVTATLYLEIVFHLILRYDPNFSNTNNFHNLMKTLYWQEENWNFEESSLRQYNESVFNLKLAYILHMKNDKTEDHTSGTNCYRRIIIKDLKNRSGVLNLSLTYLNYIEFTSHCFTGFNLFEEDFQYSQNCERFLKPLNDGRKSFLYEMLFNLVVETISEDVESHQYVIDALLLHDLPKKTIDRVRQFLIDNGKKYLRNHEDNYDCLVIAYLHKFFSGLSDSQLSTLDFSQYLRVIVKHSSAVSPTSSRLSVAKLLVYNKRLFFDLPLILSSDYVYSLWVIVLSLLEDDDEDVRKSICLLCKKETTNCDNLAFVSQSQVDIPECTRSQLLKQMTLVLPKNDSISILLTQVLRSKSVACDNLSEVFEEGSLNSYIELWPVAKAAVEELRRLFGNVRNDNHTFIAGELCSTLYKKSNAAISNSVKEFVCGILKKIRDGSADCHNVISDAFADANNLDTTEISRTKLLLNKMFATNVE